jgi:hypothetical protein
VERPGVLGKTHTTSLILDNSISYHFRPEILRYSCNSWCVSLLLDFFFGRNKPTCCPLGDFFAHAHVGPQTSCLLAKESTGSGRPSGDGLFWTADFLGRMEFLDEDGAEIIKAINDRRSPDSGLPEVPQMATSKRVNTARTCERLQHVQEMKKFWLGNWFTWNTSGAPETYCSDNEWWQHGHRHCATDLAKYYAADFKALGVDAVLED